MTDERRQYRSYLLRLWQATVRGETVWRASLTDAHTGECRRFPALAQMYEFLDAVTELQSARSLSPPESADESTG